MIRFERTMLPVLRHLRWRSANVGDKAKKGRPAIKPPNNKEGFREDFGTGVQFARQALKDRIKYGTGISETSCGML